MIINKCSNGRKRKRIKVMIFFEINNSYIYIYLSVDYSFMEWQKDKQNSFWREEEEMMSKTKNDTKTRPHSLFISVT